MNKDIKMPRYPTDEYVTMNENNIISERFTENKL